MTLPDVQQEKTGFPRMYIQKVGVENLKLPFPVYNKNGSIQSVLARINSYCSLTPNIKGINMSRIGCTVFNAVKEQSGAYTTLEPLARQLQQAHGSSYVYISADFDYPVCQQTPVTHIDTIKIITAKLTCEMQDSTAHNYLTVQTTEMSLCPCSKEMSLLKNNLTPQELQAVQSLPAQLAQKILQSGYGAHNQKSQITATVELGGSTVLHIEDIYTILAASASACTYPILKRPDEKQVTEIAYNGGYWDNDEFIKTTGGPRFVEDIARHAAQALHVLLDNQIQDYIVSVKNFESIHSDNIVATAQICADRNLQTHI